ncbi:MAG: ABC transporter permease, partial [Gammaproteobacteria bacterium]|nr:ABC transporter permease [Gammaproteobacteria bacterium]
MNTNATDVVAVEAATTTEGNIFSNFIKSKGRSLFNWFLGLFILFCFWWLGGYLLYINPDTTNFADFGPIPTFQAYPILWADGTIQNAVMSSGYRLGIALSIAISLGVPIGILLGRSKKFKEISNSPFQLLRMVSPLSWEPIAVIVFLSWDQAIIFLLTIASIWPVAFSTAAGLAKV